MTLILKNIDKGLTVAKWVLINWLKTPQNLFTQFVCPNPKVWNFDEKMLHRAFVVRVQKPILGLLICTLISENQDLEKSRSVSNLRKISGPVNLDFFF